MPNSYIRAAYGNLSRLSHLSAVNNIGNDALDLACRKFNYVAQETGNKGVKNTMIDYITTTLNIRNTDQLAAAINANAGLLLDLTNYAWRLMVEVIPANLIVPYTQMVDPLVVGDDTGMLSHTAGGFNRLGIAFRGDNRSYGQFGVEGFVARYAVPNGNFHVPEVQGTVVADNMCYDRQNRDFLNQTGVCVARNLVGSMKFISDANQGSYLYAVKMETGVDTEAYQTALGGSAIWMPGEKAARAIPKRKFLASIRCRTTAKNDNVAAEANAVWFQYMFLSDWEFHANATASEIIYIKNSIGKKKPNILYDFVRGDDFKLA